MLSKVVSMALIALLVSLSVGCAAPTRTTEAGSAPTPSALPQPQASTPTESTEPNPTPPPQIQPQPPATADPALPTPTPTAPGPTGTLAGYGTIAGLVQRGPGRDPRSGAGSALVPVPGDTVRVLDDQGKVVGQAVSAQDGSFRLIVPAGRYTVAEDISGVSQVVEVRSQAVSSVTLVVPAAR